MASYSQAVVNESATLRNSLMVLILNNASNKLPLKYSDMSELYGKQTKKLQEALPHVAQALKQVYGIILKEVPNPKSGVKKYICYSEETIKSMEELHEDQKSEIVLLFIILSYIFLMGGSIYESQLQSFLEGLHIEYDTEHSFFGSNIKKLIFETFVKQLYITRVKSDSDLDVQTRYLLSWGFRAHKEFKKRLVLQIAAGFMGREPEFFHAQYLEACAEEDEEDLDSEEGEQSEEDEDVTFVE